jgi:hypothetical protein
MLGVFKDFLTNLSPKVRRHIKYTMLMFACNLLSACRLLTIKIKNDTLDESILEDMLRIADTLVLNFIKKCNTILATSSRRAAYIKRVNQKHIFPVIVHVFMFYIASLNKIDKLSILINSTDYEDHIPRMYRINKTTRVMKLLQEIKLRLNTSTSSKKSITTCCTMSLFAKMESPWLFVSRFTRLLLSLLSHMTLLIPIRCLFYIFYISC